MNTTLTLVDLGGAIALLIWGVHMVQTGITRAFGPQLRRMLSYALGKRFKAFLAGVGVTSILRSIVLPSRSRSALLPGEGPRVRIRLPPAGESGANSIPGSWLARTGSDPKR